MEEKKKHGFKWEDFAQGRNGKLGSANWPWKITLLDNADSPRFMTTIEPKGVVAKQDG